LKVAVQGLDFKAHPLYIQEEIETNQARTESAEEELNAKMNIHQEKMEATVHSLRAW
jgi:hypothetical protein